MDNSLKSVEPNLVKKEDLQKVVSEMQVREETVITDLTKVIPYITDKQICNYLQNRKKQAEEVVVALKAGFIPVDITWGISLDNKSKWNKQWLTEIKKEMPDEIKDILDKVKELGIFKQIRVAGQGRDPVLYGVAGRKSFLLGQWICVVGGKGLSIGYAARIPSA